MATQYPVKNMLLPRSFVYATNSETLVVQSSTPESRIRLINSYDPLSFMVSSSNDTFRISKDSNIIATFNYAANTPTLTVPIGGKIRAPVFEVPLSQSSRKSFVLTDYNSLSSNQFAGFGYSSGRVQYQAPTSNDIHVFQVARDSASSAELMRIQSTATGAPQIGIGTTIVPSTLTLAVQGASKIQGDLTVTGQLTFDRTGIVQLDPATQRVTAATLPSNVVFLNSSNQLDRSLFPQEYTFQYMKAMKNVGIGTKKPFQRFHVNGSSYFSERIGIGVSNPLARVHATETSTNITALRIDTNGGNILEAYSNGSNIFTVYGTSATGRGAAVGIGTTIVKTGNVLQVQGNSDFVGNASTCNLAVYDTMTAGRIVIKDYGLPTQPVYFSLDTNIDTQKALTSTVPFIAQSGISTPIINGFGASNYVYVKNTGLRIDGDLTLGAQMYAFSDARLKENVTPITDALSKIERIYGYTYNRVSTPHRREAGVLAQEIRDILPEAVSEIDDHLTVSYDAIIPLLIQAVRELKQMVVKEQ